MLTLLVLFSGSSAAFKEAGHAYPKNLVEIAGKPLIQHVLDHLRPLSARDARLVCLLRKDETSRHHTGAVIRLLEPAAKVLEIAGETSGAACSALHAVDLIDPAQPLVIVNGDQLLPGADLAAVIDGFAGRGLDGGIVVFEDIHPRWSFVKCDDKGLVIEAAEKRPISNLATAGFYYFARGSDFVLAASEMLKKDAHLEGRFFICPAYNELILRGRAIGIHRIPRSAYRSLAGPADVAAYAAALERPAP